LGTELDGLVDGFPYGFGAELNLSIPDRLATQRSIGNSVRAKPELLPDLSGGGFY
jgi:hypothetical protein